MERQPCQEYDSYELYLQLVHKLSLSLPICSLCRHRTTMESAGPMQELSVHSYSTSQEKALIDVYLISPIPSDNNRKSTLKAGTHATSPQFKDKHNKHNKHKQIIDQAIITDNQAGNFYSNYKDLPFIFQTFHLI